jgi:hypothetical protein
MARPKKEERRQVSITLPTDKIVEYKKAALDIGMPLSRVIEEAIKELLERNKNAIQQKIGGENA